MCVADDGADGDGDDGVFSGFTGHVFVAAGSSVFGAYMSSVGEVEQGRDAVICYEHDVTTVSAVSAAWSAERDVFFASEGDCACAAFPGGDMDMNLVDEAHGVLAWAMR